MRLVVRSALAATALMLNAGCSRNPYEELTLTSTERSKVVKLHGLFKDHRVRVGAFWLANDGCDIYRSVEQDATIVGWELVELPRHGFDLVCDNGMTMAPELDADGNLQFGLCSFGLLSSGCAAYGRYRTANAIDWDCQVEATKGETERWVRCDAVRAKMEAGSGPTTSTPSFPPTPVATEGPVALARQRALVRLLEAHAASGARLVSQECVDAPCLLHEGTLDPCSVLVLQTGESQVAVAPIAIDIASAKHRAVTKREPPEGSARGNPWPRDLSAHGCLLHTPNGSAARMVLAWSPAQIDSFRYVQQVPVGDGFEVCGVGCVTQEDKSLRALAEGTGASPGAKRKQRHFQLRWDGNALGMGKFVKQ